VLNIAIGFSIILWLAGSLIYILVIFTPLQSLLPIFKGFTPIASLVTSPLGFSILVLIIFLLLRFTQAYKYLKPNDHIQLIFGMSNFVILTDIILFSILLSGGDGNGRGSTKTVFQEGLNTIISAAPSLVL
jgi:hypothetical protein